MVYVYGLPVLYCHLFIFAKGTDFHAEPIPVHSPLLRESYLVSFPPLTYMLKFSGFADLTSCHGKKSSSLCEQAVDLKVSGHLEEKPQ